jgi:hypothetical protein
MGPWTLPGRDLKEVLRWVKALLIIQDILYEFGEPGDDMDAYEPGDADSVDNSDEDLQADVIRRRKAQRLNEYKL